MVTPLQSQQVACLVPYAPLRRLYAAQGPCKCLRSYGEICSIKTNKLQSVAYVQTGLSSAQELAGRG